jgi:diphthine synthase
MRMSEEHSRGRLVFIGLGLGDDGGISARGIAEIESSDVVFAEHYTSTLEEGSLARLERRTGRSITLLDRTAVEDGKAILEACSRGRVAFLVAGDPMTATTHVDLRLRVARNGVRTEIIHGASALTAVPGILGLQHYKFGRTTTIPFPAEGYDPTSPYEVIEGNLSRGLHTLVLLDIDADNSRYMTANEGLHALMDMERRVAKNMITPGTLVCIVARAGSPDCVVRAGSISELVSESFGPPLHSLVVPGKLHFMEQEALETFAGMGRNG